MTIQIARSNTSGNVPSSLQDGQLAINQADGVLFSRNPDGSIKRTLLAKRTAVADAAFTARFFDSYIGVASLTASRTIALPAAANYPAGSPLTIADESGLCSPTVVLTIAANGSDKINGVGTVGLNSAYSAAVLISDGISKWTANLPSSGASNAILYVAQSITPGQQDQARLNVSGPTAATPSATNTLSTLDFDRDQFVTGTSTLTMPAAAAPGWRSGIISNTNLVSGLVTLAVPAGHSLDGVTNGTTLLFPYQRARLQIIGAGVWRTLWLDRTPIVGSAIVPSSQPVASLDLAVPAGFSRFTLDISGALSTTSGAILQWRSSDNGTAGLKVGASDYRTQQLIAYGTTVGASSTDASSGYLTNVTGGNADANQSFNGRYDFYPGDATGNRYHKMVGRVYYIDPGQGISGNFDSQCYGGTSGSPARCNLLRVLVSSGTLYGSFFLRGLA